MAMYLLLIDPVNSVLTSWRISIHWIRYFSLIFEDGQDICHYKDMNTYFASSRQKFLLVYMTNSSEMMIRAKTQCSTKKEGIKLWQYISFLRLELVAATRFSISDRRNTFE